MKKKVFIIIFACLQSFSIFSESIHGFNLITGYKSNSFEYDNLNFDSNIWRVSFGYSYQFYPSYDSVIGFMLSPNVGFDIPFGTAISNNGSASKVNSNWKTDTLFPIFFNADLALNFRIPRSLEKGYPYAKIGTTWQASLFQLKEDVEWAPDSISGGQQNISAFLEIGFQPRHYEDYSEKNLDSFFSYYRSDVSIRFIYDFLTKNPLTNDNWINANNFGVMLIWKPWQRNNEHNKDKNHLKTYKENRKQEIISMREKENIYSKYYKLSSKKECTVEEIYNGSQVNLSIDYSLNSHFLKIPVTAHFYRRTNSDGSAWLELSEPFLRDISFTKHILGSGKVGSDEYITYTSEIITLPFYTEEEQEKAFEILIEEYDLRQKQKERIAENRRLSPNNFDYQNLPVLSMATMGVEYAPNPTLVFGKVYFAKQLVSFYIINRMEDGTYNIGQESSVYGMYQFILKNSSGEAMGGIGGHMFAENAYFRYLGKTKVIMSNGYERWLPYFEMIKKNPSDKILKIIEECERW